MNKYLFGAALGASVFMLCFDALAEVDYAKDIQPIFDNSCVKCHKAPYEKAGRLRKPKAGLRMDTYDFVMKGSEDGVVVKSGKPEDSAVYKLTTLARDHEDAMPPEDKADPLTDAQKKLLYDWIKDGAKNSK